MRRYINSLPQPFNAGKPKAETTSKNSGGAPEEAALKWTLRTFD